MTIGVWVPECGEIPKGYGVVWLSPWSIRAFCLPVPVNYIAGAFRAWYLDWRRPCEDDPIMAAYDKGRSDGFTSGERRGYEKGLRHAAIFLSAARPKEPDHEREEADQRLDYGAACGKYRVSDD